MTKVVKQEVLTIPLEIFQYFNKNKSLSLNARKIIKLMALQAVKLLTELPDISEEIIQSIKIQVTLVKNKEISKGINDLIQQGYLFRNSEGSLSFTTPTGRMQ